jgi:hypothetical protein
LRHPVTTVQVDVNDAHEFVGLFMGGWHGGAYPGVVDENVNVGERVQSGLNQSMAVVRFRHVGENCHGSPTFALYGALGDFKSLKSASREYDVSPSLGERRCKSEA